MSNQNFFYRLTFKRQKLEDDYDCNALGEWFSECNKIGDELLSQVRLNHNIFDTEWDFDEKYCYWLIDFTTTAHKKILSEGIEKLSELIKKYPQISLSKERFD